MSATGPVVDLEKILNDLIYLQTEEILDPLGVVFQDIASDGRATGRPEDMSEETNQDPLRHRFILEPVEQEGIMVQFIDQDIVEKGLNIRGHGM